MNKTVLELQQKANIYADIMTNGHYEKWLEIRDEKFVELIINECCDTIMNSDAEIITRPQITRDLKRHFQ